GTQSGYRLFGEDDVERLETILRLQRDEFLPLRVIRQELASPTGPGKERRRRQASRSIVEPDDELDLGGLCERAAITPELARELEDFGLLQPRREGSEKLYPVGDVDIAVACAKLARYGSSERHLRAFRMAADREAGLLHHLVEPAPHHRNPDLLDAGIRDSQLRAEVSRQLLQLLIWHDL